MIGHPDPLNPDSRDNAKVAKPYSRVLCLPLHPQPPSTPPHPPPPLIPTPSRPGSIFPLFLFLLRSRLPLTTRLLLPAQLKLRSATFRPHVLFSPAVSPHRGLWLLSPWAASPRRALWLVSTAFLTGYSFAPSNLELRSQSRSQPYGWSGVSTRG